MKIDAITTCVNYSDYLVHTLQNAKHFDSFTVVTTEEDVKTQELCKVNNIECLTSNFGSLFNKGKAINDAIRRLENPDWIVLIDSDIVLPQITGYMLRSLHLHEQQIYGIDRMDCPSREEWEKYKDSCLPQHENSTFIHSGPWVTSTRIMSVKNGGYIPMGFFQMFNVNADAIADGYYPEDYDTAGNSDLAFGCLWPRYNRQLLPELIGIHLSPQNVNWKGRVSKEF